MATNNSGETDHGRLIAAVLARQVQAVDEADARRKADGQKEYIRILQEQVKSLEEKVRRLKKELKEKDEEILNLSEEIGWMDEDKVEKMKEEKKKREEEKKKDDEKRAKHIPEHVFWRFFSKFAGFNRYHLLSDEWHAANPTAANQLFGFKTWEEAKEAAKEKFFDMDFTPPQIYKIQKKKGEPYLELRECSEFEQCFAVKMMDRTGMTSRRAGLLYGRDYRTVVRWRQKWLKRWGLPSYSGGDDDDGTGAGGGCGVNASGGKHMQGASRPFQSRQMINPVRKKRPQGEEEQPDRTKRAKPAPTPTAATAARAVAALAEVEEEEEAVAALVGFPPAAAATAVTNHMGAWGPLATAPVATGVPLVVEEPPPLPMAVYDYSVYPPDANRQLLRDYF